MSTTSSPSEIGVPSPTLVIRSTLGKARVPLAPEDGYLGPQELQVPKSSGDVSLQAVTASFSPTSGTLSVFGDALDNTTTISRNAAGQILVNGGAVPVLGGTATVANTTLIQVFGQGGHDAITLDQTNGALPNANLFGGAGNDTVTGGSGSDMLFGQSGNDTLLEKAATTSSSAAPKTTC